MKLTEKFYRRSYKDRMPLIHFVFIMGIIFYGHAAWSQKAFILNGQPVELNIQFISENTSWVLILPVQSDETTTGLDNTPLLSESLKEQPDFQSRILPENQTVLLENNGYNITISGENLIFRLKRTRDEIIKTIRIDTTSGAISFELNDAPVFGLGQGAKQFDRTGALYPMVVGSKYWKMKDYDGRVPVPWLISPKGWAVFFHQPFGKIDLRNGTVRFTPQEEDDMT